MARKRGQPTKYDPSYPQRLRSFFDYPPYRKTKLGLVPNDPPILSRFALSVHVTRETLYEWGRCHPDFSDALNEWRARQHTYLLTCGLLGLTNAVITKLELTNNHGYRDRHEVNGNGMARDTHYHYTVNVQANETELARGILAAIRGRAAVPAQ